MESAVPFRWRYGSPPPHWRMLNRRLRLRISSRSIGPFSSCPHRWHCQTRTRPRRWRGSMRKAHPRRTPAARSSGCWSPATSSIRSRSTCRDAAGSRGVNRVADRQSPPALSTVQGHGAGRRDRVSGAARCGQRAASVLKTTPQALRSAAALVRPKRSGQPCCPTDCALNVEKPEPTRSSEGTRRRRGFPRVGRGGVDLTGPRRATGSV